MEEERMVQCHSGWVREDEDCWKSNEEEWKEELGWRGWKGKLKVVLPTGTLEEETINLLRSVGIPIYRYGRRLKVRFLRPHHLIEEVWFARPQHIPELVSKGICHAGICGEDWVLENRLSGKHYVDIILTLPYGKAGRNGGTKVMVFCAKDEKANLAFAREVVSEYPHLTRDFFLKKYGKSVTVRFSHGTTEALVPTLYQWGVCLVDTGQTLKDNGLKIVEVIAESSTVLITSKTVPRKRREEVDILKEMLKLELRKWRGK